MAAVKITSEIETCSEVIYLIIVDGEQLAFVDTMEDARRSILSIASHEEKLFEKKNTKVFREELEGGRKIVISTQSLGYIINGAVSPVMTITYSIVPKIKVLIN